MPKHLQEIAIYLVVAAGSLLILSFAVHMLVGGLVSEETEYSLIAAVCVLDIAAMSYMAWDIIRRRRGR